MSFVTVIVIAVFMAVDQYTKFLASEVIKPSGQIEVIPGLLNFTYLENTGMAFGWLNEHTGLLAVVTSLCLLAALAFVFFYKKHNFFTYACSALIISGGIGNLIDRIFLGYVVDFIRVSFFPPVFNVADCFVCIGAVLMVIYILFISPRYEKSFERKRKRREELRRQKRAASALTEGKDERVSAETPEVSVVKADESEGKSEKGSAWIE